MGGKLKGSGQHPEKEEDEVYMGNFSDEDFDQVGWKTKRMGAFAQNIDGSPFSGTVGCYPVFVKRSELEKAGIDPDSF